MKKYEKDFVSSSKCENISSYGQRSNISFLKIAHWYGLKFLDNYFFIRSENLKTEKLLRIQPQTFLREKVSTSALFK